MGSVGSPLLPLLWQHVLEVVRPMRLWIIPPKYPVWTFTPIGSHLTIYVDDNDNVIDFRFSPGCFQ